MQQLRIYQRRALDLIRVEFRAGKRRVVLVSPVGSGKTSIAAEMMRIVVGRGRKAVFICHRRELVQQAYARFTSEGVRCGVIQAGYNEHRDRPLQICSIQTMNRRERPPGSLVVFDEAHHCMAESWKKALEAYGGAHVVGLTASPVRLDGKGLGDLFQSLVVAATPAELMTSGYLCQYVGFRYVSPSLVGIKTVAGDYDKRGLELACDDSKILGSIVSEWLTHASNMKTIVFAVSIAHGRKLADEFRAHGAMAESIDHTLGGTERDEIMDRVRSGETKIIINTGILTEGLDIPDLACVILARPTKSLALAIQMVGRVLRPAPGKTAARVHDHASVIQEHGLPDAPREWTLTMSRKTNPGPKLNSLTTCPQCFALFERLELVACPQCGAGLAKQHSAVRTAQGVAVDIRSESKPTVQRTSEMESYIRELMRETRERGFKPGYIVARFAKRFPGAPLPWGAYRLLKARAP